MNTSLHMWLNNSKSYGAGEFHERFSQCILRPEQWITEIGSTESAAFKPNLA